MDRTPRGFIDNATQNDTVLQNQHWRRRTICLPAFSCPRPADSARLDAHASEKVGGIGWQAQRDPTAQLRDTVPVKKRVALENLDVALDALQR